MIENFSIIEHTKRVISLNEWPIELINNQCANFKLFYLCEIFDNG